MYTGLGTNTDCYSPPSPPNIRVTLEYNLFSLLSYSTVFETTWNSLEKRAVNYTIISKHLEITSNIRKEGRNVFDNWEEALTKEQ